jgi:disulfide bond formation protein DsbB
MNVVVWLFASRKRICFAVFAIIVGLLGESLFLQHIVGLEPCPLCIIQRYEFVLVGLLALIAAVTPNLISRGAHGLALVAALTGMGTAAWHVRLQLFPPVEASCGPGLEYMIGELPLTRALPMIFHGSGDCTEVQWTFLGISIAGWSLISFTIFAATLFAAWRRRNPA